MKTYFLRIALIVLAVGWCVPATFAQNNSVQGACKDVDGKPLTGAVVSFTSLDTGRKYTLKTDKKGQYFSLGFEMGKYLVVLTKDGKKLDQVNNFVVQADQNTLDFDLKKSQEQSAQQQGISPEQLQKMKEQQEKQAKEGNIIKQLNEKLAAASDATKAKNYDQAISVLTEATQLDATRALVWIKLGDAYSSSADTQTDPAEKTKRWDEAIADYKKGIDLAPQPTSKLSDQDLASCYNNLAKAYGQENKTDDAIQAYNQAAQLNPTGAGQYYFNLGATLTNSGKVDDAIAAFDKAIAADPTRAEAYYWKGVNLLGKATTKDGKMTAPDGTAEALNKYLELKPDGQFADAAKQMLAMIGAPVETHYGKNKK